jgi:hypothetical protein
MVDFENRSAAYIQVREHRKRRKPPFAGRPGVNINTPGYIAVFSHSFAASALDVSTI